MSSHNNQIDEFSSLQYQKFPISGILAIKINHIIPTSKNAYSIVIENILKLLGSNSCIEVSWTTWGPVS